jgi:hypothetical protein
LAIVLALGPGALAVRADEPVPPGVVAEARAEAAAAKAVRLLQVNGYRLETRMPGEPGEAARHFHDELGRLLSTLPPPDDTDTTLQIHVDEFRVQADAYRGREGDVLVPQGVISGMLRIVNRHGDGVGIMVIPVSPINLPVDGMLHGRSLGVEGAALVFKKILMAN